MHKFLMVDDEDVIRTGFREKIDWASLGFEFLEPCATGIQALEAVERLHPDVVMTDICMPQMGGLELCKILARDYPEIRVVVLSGHDDFEYARESLRHRVLDYILKPLTSDELKGFLARLKTELCRASSLSEGEAVRRLLDGTLASNQELPLSHPGDWTQALWTAGRLVVFPQSPGNTSPAEVLNRADAVLARRSVPWPGLAAAKIKYDGRVVSVDLFFPGDDCLKSSLRAQSQAHRLLEDFHLAGFSGCGALSQPCQGYQGVGKALAQAAQDTLLRFVRPGSLFLNWGNSNAGPGQSLQPLVARLEALTREGDRPSVQAFLGDLWRTLPLLAPSSATIRSDLGSLFAVLDTPGGILSLDETLDTCADAADLVHHLESRIHLALDRVSQQGASLAERAFRRFRNSITERFGNPDLSLDEVSRELQVSPSYLSKILRRRLSTNFSHYLREVRISKAKELLARTDLTTTQIAEETGFNDYRYFSNQFKREVGTTPTGYRGQTRMSS